VAALLELLLLPCAAQLGLISAGCPQHQKQLPGLQVMDGKRMVSNYQ
jgi:hypothetical protein